MPLPSHAPAPRPAANGVTERIAQLLRDRLPGPMTRAGIDGILADARGSADFAVFEDIKSISMLSPDVLAILSGLVAASQGAIVEFGPYVGGSTVAMGCALNGDVRPFISVEKGGAHEHPALGSTDILADLRANLARRGLDRRVTILPYETQRACLSIPALLAGERIGLVFADSDGRVHHDLNKLKRYLRPDCLLAFDDYGYEPKAGYVKPFVERAVANGALSEIGVFGFGTWVGRVNAEMEPDERDIRLGIAQGFPHAAGHAWFHYGLAFDGPWDLLKDPDPPELELFEDDRPLGPVCRFDEAQDVIVRRGRGAYGHYCNNLVFSTSDNSNPNENGRKYTVRLGDRTVPLS